MPRRGIFDRTFTIWRAARARTAAGGATETPQQIASTRGRLTPLSAREQEREGQLGGTITHRFSCPAWVDVKPRDEVRIDGEVYTVDAAPVTSRRTTRRECMVEFRQPGASA